MKAGNGAVGPRRATEGAVRVARGVAVLIAHSPRVLSEATGFNVIIHLLGAATLWALLRSVGVDAAPTGVFTAFMLRCARMAAPQGLSAGSTCPPDRKTPGSGGGADAPGRARVRRGRSLTLGGLPGVLGLHAQQHVGVGFESPYPPCRSFKKMPVKILWARCYGSGSGPDVSGMEKTFVGKVQLHFPDCICHF